MLDFPSIHLRNTNGGFQLTIMYCEVLLKMASNSLGATTGSASVKRDARHILR